MILPSQYKWDCPYCRHKAKTPCEIKNISGPKIGGYTHYWCRRERGHLGPHIGCMHEVTERHCVAIAFTNTHEYLTFNLRTH